MPQKTIANDNTNSEVKSSSLRINNMTINVQSCFNSEKELSDVLFLIATTKLKEKLA